jgi:hypothetical protein
MADKSPKKASSKKPGASLKEKRAAKKLKHTGGMEGLRPK